MNRHFPLSGECEGSCSTPDLLFAQICLFELQSGDQSMPINIFGYYFLARPRIRAKLPTRCCSERWRANYSLTTSLLQCYYYYSTPYCHHTSYPPTNYYSQIPFLPTTPYYNPYCSTPVLFYLLLFATPSPSLVLLPYLPLRL